MKLRPQTRGDCSALGWELVHGRKGSDGGRDSGCPSSAPSVPGPGNPCDWSTEGHASLEPVPRWQPRGPQHFLELSEAVWGPPQGVGRCAGSVLGGSL